MKIRFLFVGLLAILQSFFLLISPVTGDDIAEAQALLRSTAQTIRSQQPCDVKLLGQAIELQLRSNDHAAARDNGKFLVANSADFGNTQGQFHNFCLSLEQKAAPKVFLQRLRFLDEIGAGGSAHSTWLRVSMVSHAAREGKFEIAEAILKSMGIPQEFTIRDAPVFMAARMLLIELCRKDKLDDAIRIVKLFPEPHARGFLGEKLLGFTKFDPKVESSLDSLITGQSADAEITWCRFRVSESLKRKNVDKAIQLVKRMEALGETRLVYQKSRIAKLLKQRGAPVEEQYAKATEKLPDSDPNSQSKLGYDRERILELSRTGDIEQAIKSCGHWSRADVTPSNLRLQTNRNQPLCQVALELAAQGEAQQASMVANTIEDRYWQASTMLALANQSRRAKGDFKYTKELTDQAMTLAQLIEPPDRDEMVRQLITFLIEDPRIPFTTIREQIKHISGELQAKILGLEYEYRINENTDEQEIRFVVGVIVEHSPDELYSIVDKLLYVGRLDLAVESIQRLSTGYSGEMYNTRVFQEYVKQSTIAEQLDFIAKSPSAVHSDLFFIGIKNSTDDVRPLIKAAIADDKNGTRLPRHLHVALIRRSFELEDLALTKELMNLDVPKRDVEFLESSVRTFLLQSNSRSELIQQLEQEVQTGWARNALLKARVVASIRAGKSKVAINQIRPITDWRLKAELQLLAAQELIELGN